MTPTTRTDLTVPYAEKEEDKALGPRWDPGRKTWYVPPGADLDGLRRWLPGSLTFSPYQPMERGLKNP
jgi:hypothetical protein